MSAYRDLIMEATGCEPGDVRIIETLMRVHRPTLDGVTRPDFDALAVEAVECLAYLRANDPEAARFYEDEGRVA